MFPEVMTWYLLPVRCTTIEQSMSCGPVTLASHAPSDPEKSSLTMYILLGVVTYIRPSFVV